jgi:hypothetical protein
LLLQQLHGLTDAHTVEALAFNMAWHSALDVRSEADSYFCEKTLRNYRRLFIEQGFDEALFRGLTDRLVRAFAVDTSRQRMDRAALRSAMRTMTRLGIVVETISKFVRELERHHPDLYEQIGKQTIRRYVDHEGDGAFANATPSVSKRRLGEAGQDDPDFLFRRPFSAGGAADIPHMLFARSGPIGSLSSALLTSLR